MMLRPMTLVRRTFRRKFRYKVHSAVRPSGAPHYSTRKERKMCQALQKSTTKTVSALRLPFPAVTMRHTVKSGTTRSGRHRKAGQSSVPSERHNALRSSSRRQSNRVISRTTARPLRSTPAYVIDLKEHTGTKHSTIQLYLHLCERILPAIGHIKLTELRPNHLNKLYISLQEDCTKHTMDNARAKVRFGCADQRT